MPRTLLERLGGWLQRRGRREGGPSPASLTSAAAGAALEAELPQRLEAGLAELERRLAARPVRAAVVKQDVCEDLYCCPPEATPREIIESTQLRTGPVDLFTRLGAAFHVLQTVDDPECCIWQERATELHWDTLEFFASYRDRIPGKDYGQQRFAVPPESIDWSAYDLVVSIDIPVPQRITRDHPRTCWAYYVREVKAPSYRRGHERPAPGQDLFLNHGFRLQPPPSAGHVVEFPYHLQSPGCFHALFGANWDAPRRGVFVDHHTLVGLSDDVHRALERFGPVAGPILPPELRLEAGKSTPPRRTMDPDLRERLLTSKYFLMTPGQRKVHGTSLVEAIAAGSLAIGSPTGLGQHGFMFSAATTAETAREAVDVLARLEADGAAYDRELLRQRRLIHYLCAVRPLLDLLTRAEAATAARTRQ